MAPSPDQLGERLAAAKAGSAEAIGETLETCRPYLLLVAERKLDPALRPKGGASDLVQQTFLEAQRDFRRFHGNSRPELLAWLRQVLLHNVASFARRFRGTQKRQARREVARLPAGSSGDWGRERLVADTMPSPSRQVMDREKAEALQQAIDRLPEAYRQIIVLRYDEGRAFDEVARLMQRSPNAVRKLWARAIEQLQRELGSVDDSIRQRRA